jgi:hypothetical protein
VISKNIGNLKKVWKIELCKNSLAGELPPEFRKVTRLLDQQAVLAYGREYLKKGRDKTTVLSGSTS